jgi:hypothetical protein
MKIEADHDPGLLLVESPALYVAAQAVALAAANA